MSATDGTIGHMTGAPSRMLALLSLLQARRDWPGAVLAERLGVTARTVRRDVDRLRELGYRVDATRGPDGGYRLAAGSTLPPLLFDDEQAVAIAVALRAAAAAGVDVDDAAARALTTVRQVMPARLRHRLDAIEFEQSPPGARVEPAVLEAVSAAVRDRRTLRLDHGDGPPRRVEPHALVARRGRWYLLAWDLDRADWRTFRLDRATPRSPAGARFTPRPMPQGDPVAYLDARSRGAAEGGGWPCTGEAVLALPLAQVAPWIGDGHAEEVTATSSRVVLGSWSWTGLLAQLLRFDAPFTVVGPPELRAAADALSARLAASAQPG